MKNMQLLEAIGGVDEGLLTESEGYVKRYSKNLFRPLVAAVLAAVLVLSVAAAGIGLWVKDNNMDNHFTGQGKFLYADGYIYRGETGMIRGVSLAGGAQKTIMLGDKSDVPVYLFASGDYLYYVHIYDRLVRMCLDGTDTETVMEGSFRRAYADGNVLYSNDGETLWATDLNTGTRTVLLNNCREYYVDESAIYALTGEERNMFLRSEKDNVSFQEIPLSFYPSRILADGEDLYLAKFEGTGKYRIIHYRDGVETPLPIGSWFYQVRNGSIYYLEAETVKSYELATGKTNILQENVHEFSILEDRYMCFDRYNMPDGVLDLKTGKVQDLETVEVG